MRTSVPIRFIAVCCAFVLAGCGTLTVQEEKKLGHRVQRDLRKQIQLVRDRHVVSYVRDIGAEVANSAQPSAFEFRFYVVEDEDINAFAIPGGAIYVHTGLLTSANNVAEIAGVLAHEVGHVTARHVAHLYKRQRNTGIFAQFATFIIAIVSGNSYIAQGGQLATGVAAQAYLNTFTKDAEREADRQAIETLVRAGYDPMALITMLQTLQQEAVGGLSAPSFLRSHPATSERIRSVRALIRAQGSPTSLKTADRKLAIIQDRIRLIVGMEGDEEEPD